MEMFNVYISEYLESVIRRKTENLSTVVEEDLLSLYALLTVTGEEMEGYFTSQEMSLLSELFKNDEFESARIREWPTLLAWDLEDTEKCEKLSAQFNVNADILIEKLEALTPLKALWLLHMIRKHGDIETGINHTR